ncbi:MAG: NAD-dependent epimerase/dehydratase family protein [Bacteroidota bacterium]
MKIFVTGGGGFLGLSIVKQLLKEGHHIVNYSRGKYETLQQLGVIEHQGNLKDFTTLKKAMNGCQAVFHVASKTGVWGSYDSFYETNVIGTKNIIKACLELDISFLVYTSSASVVFCAGCEGGDERMAYPKKFDAYYPETKAMAEQIVLKANGQKLHTCSLRPHLIWGPGDPHILPRFLSLQRMGRLRIPGKGNNLIDTTYIYNAACGHLLAFAAMQKKPSVAGKAYFLSQDEPISIREFINRLLESGGLPPVNKNINPRVALCTGWLLQNFFRLFNVQSEPLLTLFVAKQLSSSHWYDISAAKRDLGYLPTITIDEGMKQLKESLHTNSP